MNNSVERIYLSLDKLNLIEKEISIINHVKRYLYIRHLCKGHVLDFGCGCGYGSYILSKNPDVNVVHAIDVSKDAIDWAKSNFKKDNIIYYNEYEQFTQKIDVLVAFEIIEHIKDVNTIPSLAEKTEAKEILLSFPSIKSTHFNKHHYHDFNVQSVYDLFKSNYLLFNKYEINQHVNLLHFIKKY